MLIQVGRLYLICLISYTEFEVINIQIETQNWYNMNHGRKNRMGNYQAFQQ